LGTATTHPLPLVRPRPETAVRRFLTPSLCDMFFLAIIAWTFMTSGTGWSRLLWDGDTAIHLAIGDWILDHKSIPTTDPFSFTQPGAPWIPYEWGTEVLFAQLNHAFGFKGVVFVCGVAIAALIVVMLRTMMTAGADVLLSIVIALLASNALLIHYHARPHLFTLLFLAITAGIITRDRIERTHWIWLLPPLTILWVNLHPGFTILFVYLAVLVAGSLLEGSPSAALRYTGLTAACAAATLANPFGLKLHRDVIGFLHGNGTTEFIQEFQAPTFRTQPQLFFMGFLLVGLALGGLYLRRRRFVEPLLLAGTAYAALISVRHSTVFVVLAAPMIATELSYYWQAWVARQPRASAARILDGLSSEKRSAFVRNSVWLLAGLAAIFVWTPRDMWPSGFDAKMFPVELASRHPELATARMFTPDQWADYLLYANYPRQKVFYDDRAFYGEKLYRSVNGLLTAQSGWAATLEAYRIDRVLIQTRSPLSARLRESSSWSVIDQDSTADLFARRNANGAFPEPSSHVESAR